MNTPPDQPPSNDITACIQWFQDWINLGLKHEGFASDWFDAIEDSQTYRHGSHYQFMTVRLLQRILKLEKAINLRALNGFMANQPTTKP